MADGAAPLSTAGSVDRHSALHDDLLHEIITRLPITQAVRTSALASRWRHLWRSTPLVLDDDDLPEPARDALVPRLLCKHSGPFLSVCLCLTDCRLASLDRELPDWPHHLADKCKQHLYLANRFTRNQPIPNALPRLPADILRCGSLKELLLCCWEIPVDLSRGADIFLPHLQRLDLLMNITRDQDFEGLISACPILKTLKLITANENRPKHIRLRSQSLQCALVGLC